MNNKKKIIGIVIAVLIIAIIVAVVAIIVGNHNKKVKEYVIEEIAEIEYQYFILYANEKYGVIDTKGNIIVDTKYDNVIIPNPKKEVFICSNNDSEKNIVLNSKGEEIFNIYDNVEAIALEGVISSLPYEKNVLKYEVNGQYGLIDLDGNRIVKANYLEIKGLRYKEGELLAKIDNKYGVINIKGAKLVDFKYDDIEGDKYYTEGEEYKKSGYIVCTTTEEGYRYGYITKNGEKLLDNVYNNIKRVTDIKGEDVYVIASKNGQYGLLKNKEVLIDFKYQGIDYNAQNNLLIINKGTKYGVYTVKGEEIVPIDYKTVQFNGIYIYAKTGADVKYFTSTGEEVTTGFTSMQPVNNGEYFITIDNNGLYGIANKEQKVLVENKYVYCEYLFGNCFSVYKNGSGLGIINTNGETLLDFKYTIISKIADTSLIKAADMVNSIIEIYSEDLQKISKLGDSELDVKDTYMRLYNDNESVFINMNGQVIDKNTALRSTSEAPDSIGKYEKEYMGYSQVYYMEKTEE